MFRTEELSLATSLCKRSTVALLELIATLSDVSSVRADILATATRTNLIAGGGGQLITVGTAGTHSVEVDAVLIGAPEAGTSMTFL